ncbi:MAG: asparagine synthase (glutamine-hydrolyzing) [Deltaproteobacteria bacterium]|nr:asparagine synthase (glutamine-hydrolyzing) [Deltaproteobacteria bacterium]
MCGIVGYHIARPDRGEREALRKAVAVLKQRGPDGEGFHLSDEVGLGHARLAVIDVQTGDQPLYSEDGSVALIVNSEFYNYRELNQDLLEKGHQFKTRSDSETLIHLYEDHLIEEALRRLNGMWALALLDQKRKTLVLARDRAGKKPLYYVHEKDRFLFASEIKALLSFPGLDLTINETALALYLRYGYVPTPYSIYKSIHKFPAASYGVYEDGRLTIRPYWEIPEGVDHHRSETEWLEELAATLDDAVRLRLVSDVPLGVFLSGGLDSSLIVRDMVRHAEGKVKTFCVGFDDPTYDESAHAETAARYLGTQHHVEQVDFENVNRLPELAAYFDEPFADSSFLPTWHLCQTTRKHVTVSLSGDGGDELFGGYRRYIAGKLTGTYLRLPGILRRYLVEPLVNVLPAPGVYYGRSVTKKAKLFVQAAARLENNPLAVSPRIFSDEEIGAFFPGLKLPQFQEDPLLSAASACQNGDAVETMLRSDFLTYLPDDILVKVDRMSMYHSLEVRCPFLDHRVVELAHQMPMKFKIKGFNSKYILRRLAEKGLPPEIGKRSKQGFMIPLDVWFRGKLKPFIHDIIGDAGMPWEKTQALSLLQEHLSGRHDHAPKLWTMAVLGLWSKK